MKSVAFLVEVEATTELVRLHMNVMIDGICYRTREGLKIQRQGQSRDATFKPGPPGEPARRRFRYNADEDVTISLEEEKDR